MGPNSELLTQSRFSTETSNSLSLGCHCSVILCVDMHCHAVISSVIVVPVEVSDGAGAWRVMVTASVTRKTEGFPRTGVCDSERVFGGEDGGGWDGRRIRLCRGNE